MNILRYENAERKRQIEMKVISMQLAAKFEITWHHAIVTGKADRSQMLTRTATLLPRVITTW